MQEHTILLDSWKTSKSTITLKEFRLLGIKNGYKYVPKAHEIKPPFLKEVRLPSRNMKLSIVTDSQLFAEYHKLELEGDRKVKQMESHQEEVEEEFMSTESSDSSTSTDDTSFDDISLAKSSDCDSMDCNPDAQSEECYPQVELYSPQEYNPDAQSYSLDISSSSVMADISANNDSDCDSMECNPDTTPQECYPKVTLYSPREYNLDVQSQTLREYIADEHNYCLDEYNPWKPEM